jgi:HEAT repeat protein
MRPLGSILDGSLRWAPALGLGALALLGCGQPKPFQERSLSELQQMLDDPSPTAQAQGAFGLGGHGAAAAPAVPQLVRLLESPDVVVRQAACATLGKIGPASAAAVPALVRALDDPEWIIRQQAVIAIGEIRPPIAAVEAPLQLRENDANARVRKFAHDVLVKLRSSG